MPARPHSSQDPAPSITPSAWIAALACLASAAGVAAAQPAVTAQPPAVRTVVAPDTGPVRPGIDVFLEHLPADLGGKRVGLSTDRSAIGRAGVSVIDRIAGARDLKLTALLAPAHGIRGVVEAGETLGDDKDPKTGVPIYS